MTKYKFRLSKTSWMEFDQQDLETYQDVLIDNEIKGKILIAKRSFDKKKYGLIVPMEMIEDVE